MSTHTLFLFNSRILECFAQDCIFSVMDEDEVGTY
jgi:hypothetical protein